MDKFISHDQIQVGDIIRITQTVEVTEIQKQNDSRTRFTYDGLPAGLISILPGAPDETIELVSRPVPDLPFEVGSVIQFNGERWMLRKNGHWIGSVRPGVRDFGELKALAQEYGGFEVIA